MVLLKVNVLAVLVAAIVQWVFGYLWYGLLFKKDYKALVQTEGAAAPNAGGVMALIFIANIILTFALAKIIPLTGWTGFGKGALVGAILGLGFVVPLLPRSRQPRRGDPDHGGRDRFLRGHRASDDCTLSRAG